MQNTTCKYYPGTEIPPLLPLFPVQSKLLVTSCSFITVINLVLSTFIFNPTFSPATLRSSILQRISCSQWVNSAMSSANSRSSKLLTHCHWMLLSNDHTPLSILLIIFRSMSLACSFFVMFDSVF